MLNAYLIFATLVAYIVKGMSGFASTLVFSTILSVKENNINISPVDLIVGFPSNVILVWKNRKEIRFRIWFPLAVFIIAGLIPGTILLKLGDVHLVKVMFGIVVVLLSSNMFYHEFFQKKEEKQSKVMLAVIGIASGILCGMFGIGALLAAYVSRTTENTKAFQGNICTVFLVDNIARMFLYTMSGIVTIEVWKTSILLIPFMLVGMMTGLLIGRAMNEKTAKRVIIVLLLLSGIALVCSELI